MKNYKYDWKEIQKYYDENHSVYDVMKKFGIPSYGTIRFATKRGDFTPRPFREGIKLCKHNRKILGKASTPEKEAIRCKKLSENAKLNNYGGYIPGSGRGKKTWYESPIAGKVFLDSSWELKYAKFLDENNIRWKKNWIKFPYEYQNKLRYYIPDFYLIDENEYVEVKGYKTEKDVAKWNQFPYTLRILMESDLKELNLL